MNEHCDVTQLAVLKRNLHYKSRSFPVGSLGDVGFDRKADNILYENKLEVGTQDHQSGKQIRKQLHHLAVFILDPEAFKREYVCMYLL